MNQTVPPLDQLGDFATAAARNAQRLLEDAQLLLRNRRWPTAYAVSVLAFEEAGKAWMCVNVMMVPGDIRPAWPFRELIATHADKLGAALAMAGMFSAAADGQDPVSGIAAIIDDLETLAREYNKAKQRGLYTDLTTGIVREPREVGKDEAARMVATVQRLMDHADLFTDPGFITWLRTDPDDVRDIMGRYLNLLAEAVQKGDGGPAMIAAMRAFYDETGASEGLPQMLREIEQERIRERAARNKRSQPRRPPPRAARRRP